MQHIKITSKLLYKPLIHNYRRFKYFFFNSNELGCIRTLFFPSGFSANPTPARVPAREQEFSLKSIWVQYMNHMAKKNYMEIICKFFPDFQTLIRFFSTVFKQNQKTQIFRTVCFYELETCQVSAKLKNLFFSSVHPSTHPSQRIL